MFSPCCAVGGNHEASNHLWELYYGGWVAPNIYYLGHAGVVNFAGLRIGGLSGIFMDHNYSRVWLRFGLSVWNVGWLAHGLEGVGKRQQGPAHAASDTDFVSSAIDFESCAWGPVGIFMDPQLQPDRTALAASMRPTGASTGQQGSGSDGPSCSVRCQTWGSVHRGPVGHALDHRWGMAGMMVQS